MKKTSGRQLLRESEFVPSFGKQRENIGLRAPLRNYKRGGFLSYHRIISVHTYILGKFQLGASASNS